VSIYYIITIFSAVLKECIRGGREGGGAKVKVLPNKENKGCQKGARVSRFITLDII
jgi:hypothetical protein